MYVIECCGVVVLWGCWTVTLQVGCYIRVYVQCPDPGVMVLLKRVAGMVSELIVHVHVRTCFLSFSEIEG